MSEISIKKNVMKTFNGIIKPTKVSTHRHNSNEPKIQEDRESEFGANHALDVSMPSKKFRLKDKKSGATRGIFSTRDAASKAHSTHPDKGHLVIEQLKQETKMLSFKEYNQIYEEQESIIDQALKEAKEELGEGSPFDWKKTKSEIDWKTGTDAPNAVTKDGGTVYKAREGSRNSEDGGKAEKKNVGRPEGKYIGDYKIDRAVRDTKEYKDALSAKVRAAKAEGFADRNHFKDVMNTAIKKHQLKLAGLSDE